MLTISQLFIYPIKSLSGIALNEAVLTSRGLQHDRRWMLINSENRFISQREVPEMALLTPRLEDAGVRVIDKRSGDAFMIPFAPVKQDLVEVTIWDDSCTAQLVSDEADQWFSRVLGIGSRLVFMPDDSERVVDPRYAPDGYITSFSDAYPALLIGQASLDELNHKLQKPLPINRFRPNIVFTGGEPHLEDLLHTFIINGITFHGVKLCARCSITIIDQETAKKGKEPMKTLATYRFKNNKILFGQNLVFDSLGVIAVGQHIAVQQLHDDERFVVDFKKTEVIVES